MTVSERYSDVFEFPANTPRVFYVKKKTNVTVSTSFQRQIHVACL